jgi:anti-sigma B factor antagonist
VAAGSDFGLVTASVGEENYVVALTGEADLFTAPELKHELTGLVDGGARSIVVDLSRTTFIDSTTLSVLLGAIKRLRPNGGEMGVVCRDRNIRKIFEITLLDRVFSLYETREQALAELQSPTH